ncbi:MAG: tyrosine-type recombinase/integrase [Verrucomicrobia bacterium]|nr:tyrosine-type recombinase/integrase [Verrucomicrobiota bacterium]
MTPKLGEMGRTKTKSDSQVTFPELITDGSVTVKIYKGTGSNRGRDVYTVSYVTKPDGRKRVNFADLESARKEAKHVAETISRGEVNALKLTGEDRSHFVAAEKILQPIGVSLLTAARDFRDAYDALGGNLIVEAAKYFATRRVGITRITVSDAVTKYRAAKELEGLSDKYLRDIRVILNAFEKSFKTHLDAVRAEDIRAYLNGRKGGNLARNNHRRVLVGFFTFAKGEKWISSGEPTAAELVATWKVKDKDVEIFTPDEVGSLLSHAGQEFLPWVALIAFGGVRREELAKGLAWESINFAKGVMIVPAAIAKTGAKRKIAFSPNLAEWLATYRNRKGPISALKDTAVQKEIERMCTAAEVTWKANALRHSYGSYAMERSKNAGEVSLQMGNSASVVLKHYHEIVEAEDATAYWDLRPAKPANVVPIAAAS